MSPFIRKIAIHSLVGTGLLLFVSAQVSAESKSDTALSQTPPSTSGLSIASAIQPFVDHHQIAGAVFLVATKDKVLTYEAVGFSDLNAKKAMATDQLFEIASMSKPVATTALMMLVDEGKVQVDDPVEKYLPEFKARWLSSTKMPSISC